MKELKNVFLNKDFVIKPIILKNINKFNLNMNELLLLLYFINIKNELDIEDMLNYFDINETDILNAFTTLSEKKLIETVVNKTKMGIEEKISLELFYNKLLLNMEEKKKEVNNDIYSVFEKEFGRTLSNTEYETITNWLENNYEEEMIIKALKEAILNGVTNLRYIDKILFEWTKNDSKKEYKPLFDYDWLEENE